MSLSAADRARMAREREHVDAVDIVARLQVTIFPVISGPTGTSPIRGGAGDFDLELIGSRTLDNSVDPPQ